MRTLHLHGPATTATFNAATTMGATESFDDLARLLGTLSRGWGYGG